MGDLQKAIKKAIRKSSGKSLTIAELAASTSSSVDEVSKLVQKKKKKFVCDGENVTLNLSDPDLTPNASPVPSPKKDDVEPSLSNGVKKRKHEVAAGSANAGKDASETPKSPKLSKKDKKAAKKAKKAKNSGPENDVPSTAPTTSSLMSSSSDSMANLAEWRTSKKIVVMSNETPQPDYAPYRTFDTPQIVATLPAALLELFKEKKFTNPTPIQAQTWPILMDSGKDIVGIAETGSGKTLAFGVPGIHFISESKKSSKSKNASMLVLAPTRELANQSYEVLEEFGFACGLRSMVIYGGIPKFEQKKKLSAGVDIIVGTPGRLKDLIEEKVCDLSNVGFMVLDEADRMLDLGFEEEVRYIIGQTKPISAGRQTAMFSATWPKDVQEIAKSYMREPVRVYVGFESIAADGQMEVDDSLSANKRVTQTVEVIEDREREFRLKALLNQHHKGQKTRVLVFALYKKEAARIEGNLKRQGWNVNSIHGDKTQEARTNALNGFKDCSCPLLIATDVAARGLDIPDVELVINYTFPLTIEDYVHRIGRTGRAGKTGMSYTFFQPGDKSHAGELQQVMKQAGQDVPEELMAFGSTIKKKEHKLYGAFGPRGGGPMKKATKITFGDDD